MYFIGRRRIQTKTVDILADKILYDYYDEQKTFPDSKGKRFGMSLCGIYGICPQIASKA